MHECRVAREDLRRGQKTLLHNGAPCRNASHNLTLENDTDDGVRNFNTHTLTHISGKILMSLVVFEIAHYLQYGAATWGKVLYVYYKLPVCLGSLAATLQWLTEDILPNLPHKITAIDCRILRFQVPNLELPIVFMTCRAKFYVNGQARHWGLGRKGECKSVP